MKSPNQAKRIIVKMITSKVNLDEANNVAIELSIQASKFLLSKQNKIASLKIKTKMAQGLASNADTESEQMIIKGIKKKYPEHFILAEESAYEEFQGEMDKYKFLSEKEWVWIIDPLDGTNNFLSGLDYYAVCISLAHFGKPVVGVVLRPANGDCFFAIEGKGAKFVKYTNRFKTKSRAKNLLIKKNLKNLSQSLLVTGFATEKGPMFDREFDLFKFMIGKSRGIRRMGSAALDLCYVAQGIFDCFWERGLASWDVAAAGLICSEAGVKVTDYDGQKFHPFQATIVAARTPLHNEILSLFGNRL